jgi:hypothetical protein
MLAKQSKHVRLPQRSEAVEGREKIPGQEPKAPPVSDARTISQDPVIKRKGLKK